MTIEQRIETARGLLTDWRYKTGPCPACHATIHRPDCVLVKVMDALAGVTTEVKPVLVPLGPGFAHTSCNRHADCEAANSRARKMGRGWAEHCHDDCCEDCFGQ